MQIHYQAHSDLSVEASLGQGYCPLIGSALPVAMSGHRMRWHQWRSLTRERKGARKGQRALTLGRKVAARAM